jgi:hypothetical protein
MKSEKMGDDWLPTARFSDLERRESICFGLLFSTGLQPFDVLQTILAFAAHRVMRNTFRDSKGAGAENIFPRMFRA